MLTSLMTRTRTIFCKSEKIFRSSYGHVQDVHDESGVNVCLSSPSMPGQRKPFLVGISMASESIHRV